MLHFLSALKNGLDGASFSFHSAPKRSGAHSRAGQGATLGPTTLSKERERECVLESRESPISHGGPYGPGGVTCPANPKEKTKRERERETQRER